MERFPNCGAPARLVSTPRFRVRLEVPDGDEISVAILKFCDGKSTVRGIVDKLTKQYKAKRAVIAHDVTGLLQDLADKGFMVTANESED